MKKLIGLVIVLVALMACSGSGNDEGTDSNNGTADITAGLDSSGPGADGLGGDDSGRGIVAPGPPGCNPISAEGDCVLPFPSDFFLVADPGMPSGRRVEIAETILPKSIDGQVVNPYAAYPADGFASHPPILALFPGGVDDSNLVFITDDVNKTLASDSPTVLIDADTGDFVLHFAELDPRPEDDARRALFIRPLVPLKHGRRYVVGVHGLVDKDGAPVPSSLGFQAVRSQITGDDPVLTALAERYDEDIFPVLETAGIHRPDLQLAWDFTVETEENVTKDMLTIRAAVLAWLDEGDVSITVEQVTDDVDDDVYRDIRATMTLPLYLENTEPGAPLHRDADGEVVANGTAEVPFRVRIPRSLGPGGELAGQGRMLLYGHGFFDSTDELERGWLEGFADRYGFVLVATDWWGMCDADIGPVSEALLSDPSEAMRFTDRLHQAMANQIVLAHLAGGPLHELTELRPGGVDLFGDPQVYFYGVSLGGILGATFMSLAPDIQRGALSVAAASFTFIMYRSHQFGGFLILIKAMLPDPLEDQVWVAMMASAFDRIDPITYASRILSSPFPGGAEDRRALLQVGIGDPDIPNLSAHLLARTMGLKSLQPAPRELPGIEEAPAPYDGSAIVEIDYGIEAPLPGTQATPPGAVNDVHFLVREDPAAQEQISLFLTPDGKIEQMDRGRRP